MFRPLPLVCGIYSGRTGTGAHKDIRRRTYAFPTRLPFPRPSSGVHKPEHVCSLGVGRSGRGGGFAPSSRMGRQQRGVRTCQAPRVVAIRPRPDYSPAACHFTLACRTRTRDRADALRLRPVARYAGDEVLAPLSAVSASFKLTQTPGFFSRLASPQTDSCQRRGQHGTRRTAVTSRRPWHRSRTHSTVTDASLPVPASAHASSAPVSLHSLDGSLRRRSRQAGTAGSTLVRPPITPSRMRDRSARSPIPTYDMQVDRSTKPPALSGGRSTTA
ncbi:hypothetical protein L226DRAFT_265313 [Lentinus tigrinus ALCF2SS1-7]|uniref:Uncharacterized protein n=1 Tax=Lentinus tigrinus ALCF2SS1-6 TaxID=1328759 RepID=A0A5C2S6V5_9APHY|nr:hypothetical protein L227DRAFT_178249 [Lentinus tigrinus ALCF2SS1-6]RPD69826.1 hypothetical protein L226DRAFT_265313 [Lentinus tigrinus ALCF2SS1-7]